MKSCLELPGLGTLTLHVLAVIRAVGFHVLLVIRGSALRALTLSIFGIVHILLVVTGTALPTKPAKSCAFEQLLAPSFANPSAKCRSKNNLKSDIVIALPGNCRRLDKHKR